MPVFRSSIDILQQLMQRADYDWRNPEHVAEISEALGFPTETEKGQNKLGLIEQWLQTGQLKDPYDPSIRFNPADFANADVLDMLAAYLTKTNEEKNDAYQQLYTALEQEYIAFKGEQESSIAEILNGTRKPDIHFARQAQEILRRAREQLELYPLEALTFENKDNLLDDSFARLPASITFVAKITGYAQSEISAWEVGRLKPNSEQIDVLISILGVDPNGQSAAILKLYGATDRFQSPVAEILGTYIGNGENKLISRNTLSKKLAIPYNYIIRWLNGTTTPTNDQIDKLKSILSFSEQEESVLRANALPEKAYQLSIRDPSRLANMVVPYIQEQRMSREEFLKAINNNAPELHVTLSQLKCMMHTNYKGSRPPTEEEAMAIIKALNINESDGGAASKILSMARPKGKGGPPHK